MAEHIWQRFGALPLSSVEKGAIYASIRDASLEELQKLFPAFLDDLAVASSLRKIFLMAGVEQFRPHYANWGSPSLLCIAPSSMDNKTSKALQEDSQGPAVLNFRPPSARPPIPLQLAHPVFGTFLDIYYGAPGAPQPRQEDYEFFVNLASECSNYFSGEVADYRPMVRRRWADYTKLNLVQELFTGHTASDIAYALEHLRALILILEAKLGLCGTATDPMMQASQNYRLYWAKVGDEARFASSCFPALVLEHVGPLVRVSAITNLPQLSFQPLTPFVNLLVIQGSDLRAAEQGSRLCLAVKKTLEELISFYVKMANTGSKVGRALFESGIPYPLHRDGISPTRWGDKLVYLVNEEKMVVKYVQREYGEAVHRPWAAAGYAPRLLKPVTLIPGGWLEVSIEYLGDGWKLLQSLDDADDLRPQVLEVLDKAHKVPVGGSVGVHGDMRDMNVMVKKALTGEIQVKFIDFDWAREQGRGFYPSFMNHRGVKWPTGAASGLPMLQTHDAKLLGTPRNFKHESEAAFCSRRL